MDVDYLVIAETDWPGHGCVSTYILCARCCEVDVCSCFVGVRVGSEVLMSMDMPLCNACLILHLCFIFTHFFAVVITTDYLSRSFFCFCFHVSRSCPWQRVCDLSQLGKRGKNGRKV